MARPNRPRIAGQRRRPDDTTGPDDTTRPVDIIRPVDSTRPVATARPDATTRPVDTIRPVDSTDAGTTRAVGGRRLSLLLSGVLGVLIVLILTFAGVLGVKAWRGQQAEDARNAAATAGRKAAETALSYDYRSLDKNFAAARATMTPDFAAKFDATAKVAGELATKSKATVRADVREVGVRDGDANRVTLVIFVNQTTTSTITQGKPRVDLNRTRFTMVRNGDQWLVQEISGL
jgi:Mce-associated membrane protein